MLKSILAPLKKFQEQISEANEAYSVYKKSKKQLNGVIGSVGRAGTDQKAQELDHTLDSAKRAHITNSVAATLALNNALDTLGLDYADVVRGLADQYSRTSDKITDRKAALDQDSAQICRAVASERNVSAQSMSALRARRDAIASDLGKLISDAGDYTNAQTTEGYLLTQSQSSVVKLWSRRYFAIRASDGALVHYTDDEAGRLRPSEGLPLVLTTTKPRPDVRRFCFELVAPQSQLVLQAENAAAYARWLKVIENVRAAALEAGPVHEAARKAIDSSGPAAPLDALRALDPANRTCCDCGAPDPDWVSINLGALCCLRCSGAHRALGVGVSKVRSLSLDSFDPITLLVVAALGNRRVNKIYAANVPANRKNNGSGGGGDDDDDDIASFVHSKYALKAFVAKEKSEDGDDDEYDVSAFAHACRKEDLAGMLGCIAHGADVDSPRRQGSAETLLHYATRKGLQLASAFLILNGADPNRVGSGGNTPLHYAAETNLVEAVALLLHAGAKVDPKNEEGLTPLDIALKCGHSVCCTLLRIYAIYRGNDVESREEVQLSIRDIENTFNTAMTEQGGGICAMMEEVYKKAESLERKREKAKKSKKRASNPVDVEEKEEEKEEEEKEEEEKEEEEDEKEDENDTDDDDDE